VATTDTEVEHKQYT